MPADSKAMPKPVLRLVCVGCHHDYTPGRCGCPSCGEMVFRALTVGPDDWICTFCEHVGTDDDFSDMDIEDDDEYYPDRFFCQHCGNIVRVVRDMSPVPTRDEDAKPAMSQGVLFQ